MLAYDLGKMKSVSGYALRYEVEEEASRQAISISHIIEHGRLYKMLAEKIPSSHLILYFQFKIKEEIYPSIRNACIIRWYRRNNRNVPYRESRVKVPKAGIFILLKECWDFNDVPLVFINPITYYFRHRFLLQGLIRGFAKRFVENVTNWCSMGYKRKDYSTKNDNTETIACHYAEGLDFLRRNDLSWYIGSGIDPKKVLIYFDNYNHRIGKPIEKKVIQQIEASGFRWVALKRNIIEGQGRLYWEPRPLPEGVLCSKRSARNIIERWVLKNGNRLLKQVYYWRSFYDDFNIRINYIPEEGFEKNIAQAIAFDIGKNSHAGILVGKQRSEIFKPLASDSLGFHPKHIFFVWSERVKSYLYPNHEQIEQLIVTGYPYHIFTKDNLSHQSPPEILRTRGVEFVIALFDDVHGPDIHYSTSDTANFYKFFLQWVLDDPLVGLVIKSKKPIVIARLPMIQPLLNDALQTERCIKMEKEWGMLPSNASVGADIAIGCGISTAIIEAVLGGCRGIHYDMAGIKKHEFYSWGYERIIFDDLERLLVALRGYKNGSKRDQGLGDWSLHINKLDSFCDGKGGQRMGMYMRWLLEGFEKNMGFEETIQNSNRFYAEKWGSGRVTSMKNEAKRYME